MRKKLQTLREGAGYTQQTFSERLGVSRSHYAQIESGDKNPSLKLSLKIKQALGYPYDDLFFNPKRPVSRHRRERKAAHGAVPRGARRDNEQGSDLEAHL